MMALYNKPTEMRMQLGGASCDIYGWYGGLLDDFETFFKHFFRHDFRSVRARIHMAVRARLITTFAQIDLKYFESGGL